METDIIISISGVAMVNGRITGSLHLGNPVMCFHIISCAVISAVLAYNNKGYLSSITRNGFFAGSGYSQTYNLVYDDFGNMTSIGVGSQNLATYNYGTQNNNLKTMTYGNGASVTYSYDNLDRVTQETWTSGANTRRYQYVYNTEGQLSKKLDTDTLKAVNYEYDSLGRLIHSSQTTDNTINQYTEHAYDTANRISRQAWQLGVNAYTESYSYNSADGSLSQVETRKDNTALSKTAFTYDPLKRLQSKAVTYNNASLYTENYTYVTDTAANTTTMQVASLNITQGSGSQLGYTYSYDSTGNIISANRTDVNKNVSYTYDEQGQLTSETIGSTTYDYTYDTYGNIRGATGGSTSYEYSYSNSNWKDLLTSLKTTTNGIENTVAFQYDAIGNPTHYYNGTEWNFTWENGRQLVSAKNLSTNKTSTFTYGVDGIRDSKTYNGTTYTYQNQNGQVVRQTWGTHKLDFIYDNNGRPASMVYDGTRYHYVLNLQGDVIRLLNNSGATVQEYEYDAWGRPLNTPTGVGAVNPLRYRGYYYDTETGLYYLQSRYYDPVVKRFINADFFISAITNPLGYNVFAYCESKPVSRTDFTGHTWQDILSVIQQCSAEIGQNIQSFEKGYNWCLELSNADGPYPVADSIALCGAALLTTIAVGNGIYRTASQARSTSHAKSAARSQATSVTTTRRQQYSYWAAELIHNTVVVMNPLTFSEAQVRVACGKSIMCKNQAAAMAIIIANQYRNAVGPERHGTSGYYWHYHPTRNHTGSKDSTHIWFYGGIQ